MGRMKTYAFNDLDAATLAEIASVRYERAQPAFWDDLARREIDAEERAALARVMSKLVGFRSHMANEATVWARAIYPILVMAERGDIVAFARVPLSATFADVVVRGETDGALAGSVNEEPDTPYLVIIEAKRGIGATDPVSQLVGAMLCAAWRNVRDDKPAEEIFGVYTIADVWTFLRAHIDWSQPKPSIRVLPSREYVEKTEAEAILGIVESVVERSHP